MVNLLDFDALEYFTLIFVGVLIVVGTYFKVIIERWIKDKTLKTPSLRRDSTRDLAVKDILTQLRTELSSDRVMIFRFHNGGNWPNKEPMKKLSCTYEAARIGTTREADSFKDVLVSKVPELVSIITNETAPQFFEVDQLPYSFFRSYLCNCGVESVAIRALYVNSDRNYLLGAIIVNFDVNLEQLGKDFDMELAKHRIDIAAIRCEALLSSFS